jgi:hypothetical protein
MDQVMGLPSDEERFNHEVQSEQEWVHDMLGTPWAAEVGKDEDHRGYEDHRQRRRAGL